MHFDPTRAAALRRLDAFVPRAGADYARLRNFDRPDTGHPHVSGLSPYLRHRVISEPEVLRAVLARHSPGGAEKFIQEVVWRTYWKGWLERRPSVWSACQAGVRRGLDRLAVEGGLRADWEAACTGTTGIGCFDAWAHELVRTGYLHNHARMWFASIWIFTLRLPWELGADFFLRHLLDGDAASNTLGWRWVAGLHTPGKTYLARADNIATYTSGRFDPAGPLAAVAPPVEGYPNPPLGPMPTTDRPGRGPGVLVLTEDQLTPDSLPPQCRGVAVLCGVRGRSPLAVSNHVTRFTGALVADALGRLDLPHGPVTDSLAEIEDWARGQGATQLVLPYVPQGPARDLLTAAAARMTLPVVQTLSSYDAQAWPQATAGFFRFKSVIPALLRGLDQPALL